MILLSYFKCLLRVAFILMNPSPSDFICTQTQTVTCLTTWGLDLEFNSTGVINNVISSLMTRNSESLEFVSDPKVTPPDKVLKFLIHYCLKQEQLPIKSHILLPHGMDVSQTLMFMLELSQYLLICKR